MGPMPVPEVCPICARAAAEEAARPAVPGYGIGDATRRARENRAANGAKAGEHRTERSEVRFPQKRNGLTSKEFTKILAEAGRRKKEMPK